MKTTISRPHRVACIAVIAFWFAALALAPSLSAQTRVDADSSWRLHRYGHDLVYGTALGLLYAGIDQYRNIRLNGEVAGAASENVQLRTSVSSWYRRPRPTCSPPHSTGLSITSDAGAATSEADWHG